MQIPVVTNKGAKNLDVTSSYEALTVHQLQQLLAWDGKNHIPLFAILSGLPIKYIQASTDFSLETKLLNAVRFIYEQKFEWPKEIPQFLTIKGQTISIPRNIGRLSIGQNIQARITIAERATVDIRQAMSIVVAIYLQPLVCGKDRKNENEYLFSFEDALELEQEILKMPAMIIYPLGFFLLRNVNASGQPLRDGLKRLKTNLINNVSILQRLRELKG